MKNLLTTIGLFVVLTKGYAIYREYNEYSENRSAEAKRSAAACR